MDGFIGYSTSGYNSLMNEISSNKSKLLSTLESFDAVYTAIENCWIGEDATAYLTELKNAVNATYASVSEAYDALANQCRTTYDEWVAKQSAN